MKTQLDITYVIANLVRQSVPDLDKKLKAQEEALSEIKCIQSLLGVWIDAFDVEYLLSVLALDDDDFASQFSAGGNVSMHQRKQIAAIIEEHFEHCEHCALKKAQDLEMNIKFEEECRKNREFLLQLVEK